MRGSAGFVGDKLWCPTVSLLNAWTHHLQLNKRQCTEQARRWSAYTKGTMKDSFVLRLSFKMMGTPRLLLLEYRLWACDLSLSKREGQLVKQQQWRDARLTSRLTKFFSTGLHLLKNCNFFHSTLRQREATNYSIWMWRRVDFSWKWSNSSSIFFMRLSAWSNLQAFGALKTRGSTGSDQLHMQRQNRQMSKKYVWPSKSKILRNQIRQVYSTRTFRAMRALLFQQSNPTIESNDI